VGREISNNKTVSCFWPIMISMYIVYIYKKYKLIKSYKSK